MRNTTLGVCVATASLFASCSRDLTLPPVPVQGPGSISGRAVIAVPGQVERTPAAGAVISLLASTVSVTSGANGLFTLNGITQSSGGLLLQYDGDKDGGFGLQRLLALEDIGAGPNRLVNIGDVLLAEPARVHGKALRGDRVSQRGGQAGTIIFVPEGPFTTFTADDGTFALEELPEGTFQISAFRSGYVGVTLSGVNARAGEDISLRDIVLAVETGTPDAGGIAGSLQFVPATDAIGATIIARSVFDDSAFNGTVSDDGTFSIAPLPPGVYDVRASRPDYTTTTAPNVAVQPDHTTQLVITVGMGAPNDTMHPPVPDAGTNPGGLCTTTPDCPSTQWCDDGLCAPQCAISSQCTNGRVCDTATRTCVTPCGGGQCPSGQACDSATNLCRSVCEGAFPCPATFVCSAAQLCVPECLVSSDCPGAHRSCQAGACVSNGTCDFDVDCPLAQLCLLGSCTNRPTAFVDGGADGGSGFACASPCECKMGEVCNAGVCLPDFVPNRFLAADGGGDGLTPATAASALPAVLTPDASVTVALRQDDLFVTDGGPAFITAPNTVLAGGYVVCSPNRWVRDGVGSSAVSSSTSYVLTAHGNATRPLTGISLEGVDLVLAPVSCPALSYFVDIAFADGLAIDRMRVMVPRPLPCGSNISVTALNIASSHQVLLENLSMEKGGQSVFPMIVLASLTSGSGRFEHFTAPSQLISGLTLAQTTTNDGPVTIHDFDVTSMTVTVAASMPLINARQCLAPVTISDNHLQFPVVPAGGASQIIGVQAVGCPGVAIDHNDIDGRGILGGAPASGFPWQVAGIWVEDSTGSVTRNRIDFFEHANGVGGAEAGIYVKGPRAVLDIDQNAITMPSVATPMTGVRIETVTQPGTLTLHHLVIDGGVDTSSSIGIGVDSVGALAGLAITDVDVKPPSTGSGNCIGAVGLSIRNSLAYLERLKLVVPTGTASTGLVLDGAQAELYESFISTGSSTCSSQALSEYPSAIVTGNTSSLWATGNTFEVGSDFFQMGTSAVFSCEPPSQLFATSNIFGGGAGPTHIMVRGTGSCVTPANFNSNYFWYSRPGGRTLIEQVGLVTSSDGGLPDGRGNIVNDANVSPYGSATQPAYVIAAGSPVIDLGVGGGLRRDGGVITQDIDGRQRKNGAEVDIGAYEH